MLHRFRERFGTAGLIVAIVALVLALTGGAFAATGGLNAKQKKEVTKIAKKYAGKAGATGAAGTNGTNGTNGAKGDTGAAGSNGTDGTNGTNGTNGVDGTSVTTSAATVGECPNGGTKFTSASPASKVCNGTNGTNGTNGSPWTAGGTLPVGSTETGAYAGMGAEIFATITFAIPLSAPLDAAHVKLVPMTVKAATGTGTLTSGSTGVTSLVTTTGEFIKGSKISGTGIPAGATITACSPSCGPSATGLTLSAAATASGAAVPLTAPGPPAECENAGHSGAASKANPEASSGYLCVYAGVGTPYFTVNPSTGTSETAGITGAALYSEGEFEVNYGTYAVTG